MTTMDEITVEDCKIVKIQRDGGRSVEDIAEMFSWTTAHVQRIVDADVESLVMNDKMRKLLETIRKDLPRGCDGLDCSECMLKPFNENTLERRMCRVLQWQRLCA